MTFPAITEATNNPIAGVLALIVGIILSWCGRSLFTVAVLSCLTVFIAELILWSARLFHCLRWADTIRRYCPANPFVISWPGESYLLWCNYSELCEFVIIQVEQPRDLARDSGQRKLTYSLQNHCASSRSVYLSGRLDSHWDELAVTHHLKEVGVFSTEINDCYSLTASWRNSCFYATTSQINFVAITLHVFYNVRYS